MPPAHPLSALCEQWGKDLEKKTNGRVKVVYFPAGTLVNANQMYDGVVKGIIDIGWSVVSYTPGRMPLTEVFDLPLGFKSGVQATRTANAFIQKFNPKEYNDVKLFYLHSHGPGGFHSKTPVNRMEELKGLRFKGDGNTSKIIAAAGGTPTTIPMLELYDSLKRGVADGAFIPIEGLKGWKLGEILHYTYYNNGTAYSNPFFVAMNKEKWKSLPKDIQQTIDELDKEYVLKTGKLWDELDAEAIDFVTKRGHKITKATQAEEATMRERQKPLLDAYVKNTKAKGLPGDEVLRWVQAYLKTAAGN